MISETHPTSGTEYGSDDDKGSRHGKTVGLMPRLLWMLLALLGSAQAWAGCPEPTITLSPTSISGEPGQTQFVGVTVTDPVGACFVPTDFYVAPDDPEIADVSYSYAPPTGVFTYSFQVEVNLISEGETVIRLGCLSSCATTEEMLVEVVPPTIYQTVMNYVSGDNQTAAPGEALPLPLVVELLSYDGSDAYPVYGQTIIWTVSPTSASPTPSFTTITESDGRTSANVTISENFIGEFTITATTTAMTLMGSPPSYTFHVTSESQTQPVDYFISKPNNSGDGSAVTAGSSLALKALVTSEDGLLITGQSVNWQVLEGGASPGYSTVVSDYRGEASVNFTFPTVGTTHIRAMLASDSEKFVDYTIKVEPASTDPDPDAVSLDFVSGDDQSVAAGQPLPEALVVSVLRSVAGGTPQPDVGATVVWTVNPAAASPTPITTSTVGSDGRAAITIQTSPDYVGSFIVRAEHFDVPEAEYVFSASTTDPSGGPELPPNIAIESGDGQSGAVNTWLADDFVVVVTSAVQAPPSPSAGAGSHKPKVEGVLINWTVISGNGELETQVSTTDAQGRARNRLRLGPQPGPNTVIASTPDGAQAVFTATATQAAATRLVLVSGGKQMKPVGWPTDPLVVRTEDGNGNPVPGTTVEWTPSNATISADATVTGSDGQTSIVAQAQINGPAFVTARIPSDPSTMVTFVINGGLSDIPGLSPLEGAYGRAMEAMWPVFLSSPALTPEQQDLMDRCAELIGIADSDASTVRNVLDTMHQDTAPTQANAAIQSVDAQLDNISSRLVALRGGASGFSFNGLSLATPSGTLPLSFLPSAVLSAAAQDASNAADPGFARWGFFATGTIGRGSRDRQNDSTGYDFDTAGLTAGFDYRVRDNLILGVSLGYNRQDTDMAGGRGKVDTDGMSFSLYGSWYSESSWYLDAVLSYGDNSYDLDRHVQYQLTRADGTVSQVDQIARASGDSTQKSLSLSAGRDFQKGAWNFSPYLRGEITRIELDGYEETMLDPDAPGAGLALAVDARELDSRTLTLGSRLSYTMSRDWGILTPHAHVELERQFKDDPDQITAYFRYDPLRTPIPILGEAIDSNYGNVGIGISALWPKGRSAFLLYEKLLGASGLSRDTISLGVRMEF